MVDTVSPSPSPVFVHRHKVRPSIGGLRRHIRGETRNTVTDANEPMLDPDTGEPLGVELLTESMSARELRRLGRERKAAIKGVGRHEPKKYAEMLFTSAKRTQWTPAQAREWAAEVKDWIADRYPDSPIVECALHLDESQYHVHALIFPRGRTHEGGIAYGLTAASRAADSLITGEPIPKRLSLKVKKAAASRLLDDGWERLGRPFGLGRGELGSTKRTMALSDVERAKRTRQEADELKAQAEALAIEAERVHDEQTGLIPSVPRAVINRDRVKAKKEREEADARIAEAVEAERIATKAMAALEVAKLQFLAMVERWAKAIQPKKARDARWLEAEEALERGIGRPREETRQAQAKDEQQRRRETEIKRLAREQEAKNAAGRNKTSRR